MKKIDLKDKIVLAHKGFFDRESIKHYRENSKEVCKISGTKNYIETIELDVRKSRDGILYCHHGSFLQYFLFLKFPRKFFDLQKKCSVDSLPDILDVIPESKRILLDLKDTTITREDILEALEDKIFKEVILGNTSSSLSFLKKFNDLPSNFSKIMNGNIFCTFYDLTRLKEENYKYYEVLFPFQVNKELKEKAEKNGLAFSCAPVFFLSTKNYFDKINKYQIRYISSDFI